MRLAARVRTAVSSFVTLQRASRISRGETSTVCAVSATPSKRFVYSKRALSPLFSTSCRIAETFFSKAGSKDFPRSTIRLNSRSKPFSDVRMMRMFASFASCPVPRISARLKSKGFKSPCVPLYERGNKGGLLSFYSFNARSQRGELLLDGLVAPVDVVDTGEGRLAFRHEAGDNERGRCPQVRRHDGGALESLHALDDGVVAVDGDAGAQAPKLRHVHEAVFEDGLRDDARAPGNGHEGHDLGLQIRREARVRKGLHVDAFDLRGALDAKAALDGVDGNARLPELYDESFQVF